MKTLKRIISSTYRTVNVLLNSNITNLFLSLSVFAICFISGGNVMAQAPSTQATSIVVSAVTSSGFNINWTDGNGSYRAVFMKQDNTGTAAPVDATTYTPNTIFGSGTEIASSGWFCVFNGDAHASGVDITGLSATTEYIVMVCEYNGSGVTSEYLTTTDTDNPKTQLTLNDQSTADFISKTSGDFNDPTTWTYNSTGSTYIDATQAPGADNNVNIEAAHTVTLTAGATINSGSTIGVDGILICGTNQISGTGDVTLLSNGTLKIGSGSGIAGNITTSGLTMAVGTVEFNGGVAQTMAARTFDANLTINNSSGVALSGDVISNGTLTLTSGALSIGANTLTVDGGLTLGSGSFTGGTSSNLIFTGSGGNLTLPTITGGLSSLTLNRANGITLGTSLFISGALTFTSGNITSGAYKLRLGGSATISQSSGYVIGNIERILSTGDLSAKLFPVGNGSDYTPVTIDVDGSGGTAGSLLVTSTASAHANVNSSGLNTAKTIGKYWSVTPGTFALGGRPYKLKIEFVPGDIPGGSTYSNFEIRKYNAGWTAPTGGSYNRTSTSTEYTNFTSFSDFIIGEAATAPSISSPTATDITNNSATLGGTVTSDGGSPITERGTVWSTSPSVGIGDNKVSTSGTTGLFTHSRTSIDVGTQIYYKAYAINSVGTTLSSESSFYTLAAEPTGQASNITFSTIGLTFFTVDWTDGLGSSRAVFIKQANTGTASPVDGTTYTADLTFGSGTEIPSSSGWFCIFNGTSHSSGIDIIGLTAGTEYIVQVFEYNGSSSTTNYFTNTATNNPKSQATLSIESTADFRSKVTGDFNAFGTWEYQSGGSGWIAATQAPGADNNVFIRSGHTVTLTTGAVLNDGIDITIESGGILDCGTYVISDVGDGNLTLNSGGTLKIASLTGLGGNITLSGTVDVSSGTVEFNGAGAQSLAANTFSNLTINNSSGVNLSGAVSVTTTLTLTDGALSIGANTLTVSGDISLTSGTLSGGASSNLSVSGAGGNLSIPAISGGLNNLTLNRSNGITLAANLAVAGTLTLTSGNITTTASYNITLGGSASVSRTSGHVVGDLEKTLSTGDLAAVVFEVGNGTDYTPVTLDLDGTGGTAGTIVVSSTASVHANIATSGLNSAKTIEKYWSVTPTGTFALGGSRTFKLNIDFLSGDIPASADEANFVLKKYNAGWTDPAGAYTRTSTSIENDNFASFSDFIIGEVQSAPTVTTPTATSIADVTATLGGNVTDDGGDAITAIGVVWAETSLQANPIIGDGNTTNVIGTGTTGIFTVSATSLPAATQISYRAYATNGTNTTYTTAETFYTLATEPVNQALNIVFSSVASDGFQVDWTNGATGTGRAVFMKEGAGSITNPTDAITYTASNDWSSKQSQLGSSGYYCIYNGASTTVTMTNLSPNATYYVQVFEYNGSATTTNYYTATETNNPNSQLTLNNQSTADFRSKATGDFNVAATWEYNSTGSTWADATQAPAANNNVTVQTGHTVTMNSADATINDGKTLTIAGTGNLTIGANTLTINGDLSVSGTITGGGSSNLSVGGTGSNLTVPAISGGLNNLTLNRSNGLTLDADLSIAGTLTFTSGKVTTGANTLIIASGGSVSGGGTGWVIGKLQKNISSTGVVNFEIGASTNYRPINLDFTAHSVAGDITASVTQGDGNHANIASATLNAAKTVKRYYTLTNTTVAGTYDATFNFVSADVPAGATTSSFIVGKYISSWSYPTVGTKTSTSTQITGETSFSDFIIGETQSLPTVTSPTATTITNTTATLGGNITDDGGSAILEHGTIWELSSPIITDNASTLGAGSVGIFPDARTGFPAKTKIYYAAYATNGIGTTISSEGTFYTLATEPSSHAGSFAANPVDKSSVYLSWTAATGADKYLIVMISGGSASVGTPDDATAYSISQTLADGTVVADVSGTNTTISGLTQNTQYTFTIFPYAWDATNDATKNYKTDATIPEATATTTNPTIDASSVSLTGFTYVLGGGPSSSQTLNISGSDLSPGVGSLSVTGTTNYEVSDDNSSWGDFTINYSAGTLSSTPIYIRLKSGLSVATYDNEDVTVSGGGASDKLINCNGSVTYTNEPTVQASSVNFTNVQPSQITVNFTAGNGSNRIVLVKSGSSVNSDPVDANTYTANTAFGSGTQIGTGNYVVYTGTGTSVTVTGLSPYTTYYVAVYDFNGSTGVENYLTTSPATGDQQTIDNSSKVVAPSSQIAADDIASTVLASGAAVSVFSFKISDLGGDALNTKVTQVTIKKASGTAVWSTAIAGAELWDGTQITTGTPVITNTEITIPITSGNLDVTEGGDREVTLKIWLSSTVTDNTTMAFEVSATSHGFTAHASGSSFAADFVTPVSGNTMTITVTATQLTFTTQPPSSTCPNANVAPAVVVSATDASENVDVDYANTLITLTNSSALGWTGNTSTTASGVATFSSIQFTDGGTVTLSTDGLGGDPSNSIDITVPDVTSPLATSGNAQATISWTNPSCYDEIMVIAKASGSITHTPTGDGTAYTANSSSFTDVSNSEPVAGEIVVYRSNGTSVNVTSLTNSTTYYFKIFTRNGTVWSTGTEVNTTPFAPATSDYFRTVADGNWSSNAVWEQSSDNSIWVAATMTPDYNANLITISSGQNVTMDASTTVDQLTITGNLTIASAATLTTNAGDGNEITIDAAGSLTHSGTVGTMAGTGVLNGTYVHNTTSTASTMVDFFGTKAASSNWTYRGSATLNADVDLDNKSFGNLSFESSSGTWAGPAFTGTNGLTVNGNFTLGSNVTLTNSQTGTCNYKGNFTVNGTLTNSTGTQDYTFNGTSAQVIGGSSSIEFEAATINNSAGVSLGTNLTVQGALTLTSGAFAVGSNTLILNDAVSIGSGSLSGTTSSNITLGASGAAVVISNIGTLNDLTVNRTAGLTLNGTTIINGTVTIAGSTSLTCDASTYTLKGNWANSGTFTHGNSTWVLQGTSPQTMSGSTFYNLTIDNSDGVTLLTDENVTNKLTLTSGALDLNGNALNISDAATVERSSGSVSAAPTFAGTVNMIYSNSGSISSGPELPTSTTAITNLSKTNGGGLTLGAATYVNGALTLTSGIITNNSTNFMQLNDGATLSGGGEASYITSTVAREYKDAGMPSGMVYPLGSNGRYRPFTLNIDHDDAASNVYKVELIEPNAQDITTFAGGSGLQRVSLLRRYDVSRPTGTSGIDGRNVTLYYNNDDAVSDFTKLVISQYTSGVKWDKLSGGCNSPVGSNSSGYIAGSDNTSSVTSWALGSTDEINPLPIEMLTFTAQELAQIVNLSWSTASEINNNYFEIQRSYDSEYFEDVEVVMGAGNSNVVREYNYIDKTPFTGLNYYRLKQVDFDGEITYSQIVSVVIDSKNSSLSSTQPFFNGSSIEFNINNPLINNVRVQVYDLTGRIVGKWSLESLSQHEKISISINLVGKGIYFLKIDNGHDIVIKKFYY